MTKNIDPTKEQFEYFKSLPRETSIMMLNLISFNEQVAYEDGRAMTGKAAYELYGKESSAIFKQVGGEIIWRGQPESVVIGPSDECWDVAFIAQYPNAGSFLAMVTDSEYQAIVYHRQAAVKDSRLIRMGSNDLDSDVFG